MKMLIALGLTLSLAGGSAYAQVNFNESNKFFDESGNLVGQQVVNCSNFASHAGNVHTAYVIQEQVLCSGAGGKSPPHITYIVPGTIVTHYTLPSFLGIQQACSIAECNEPGIPEIPLLTDQGWTWENGTGN